MLTHPEQTPNEIFVGNTSGTSVPGHLSCIVTARVGAQAYYLDGDRKIPPDHMRPLFVGRKEADQYDAIMMDRFRAASRGR
jgi:hypothetical protein